MGKILITGATGFFGKNLLEILEPLAKKFSLTLIYRQKGSNILNNKKFRWIKGNLLDIKNSKVLIEKEQATHLLHLAWYVSPQQFWSARQNIDWFHASCKLFEFFAENGGKVFIGAGSLAEYDWGEGFLDEENDQLRPATVYGQAKRSLHEMITKIRNAYYPNVKIIWPRIGYFYGPHEPKEKLIPKLIQAIKNEQNIDLAVPEFSRPYAHVNYFALAMEALLRSSPKEDFVFNLSASFSYTLREIVNFIQMKLGKKAKINYGAYLANPLSLRVNNRRLQENLGINIPDNFFSELGDFVCRV